MAKNKIYLIFILILVVFLIVLVLMINRTQEKTINCTEEAKICPDGSSVGRTLPDCHFSLCPGEEEGILVSNPKTGQRIESPLIVKGQARGFWFFEAEFIVQVFDDNDFFLGQTILRAEDDWMTEEFVSFQGNLIFSQPSTNKGFLKFLKNNPSGLAEHDKTFQVEVYF
jgi:hypothetical protein